jgi:hypothetical protein
MKTSKIFALAVIATSVITSAAYAGGSSIHDQRIAKENYDYFKGQGVKDSGQPVAQNPNYTFQSRPEQRLAASNAAYFQGKASTGTVVTGANKDDYVFNSRPEQRLAARNAAYFNQK